MDAAPIENRTTSARARRTLRRLGAVGFAFFLIKGLAWLAIPAWIAYDRLVPAAPVPAIESETPTRSLP